ncbi:unnamed protein product, partial [Rotaria magnacalcarata]
SSRSKILNHIKVTYGIEGGKTSNNHLRAALKALLEESVISLAKGTGYINGYYRIVSKGKKQNNKKSSSQSTTAVHDKKPSDKPRSQSKSGNKSKTDGQRRSRSSSKIQAKSTNKNRSSGRKSDQSTVSRSRSPIKKSKGDDQKSNQAHQSRSRSITKSRNSMTKQPTEKPKSPQRGRAKVGQKRQALKEVNDNQKSVNKSKQTRSRSSKRKSTGNNNVTSSPTKQARTSTGFRNFQSKKNAKKKDSISRTSSTLHRTFDSRDSSSNLDTFLNYRSATDKQTKTSIVNTKHSHNNNDLIINGSLFDRQLFQPMRSSYISDYENTPEDLKLNVEGHSKRSTCSSLAAHLFKSAFIMTLSDGYTDKELLFEYCPREDMNVNILEEISHYKRFCFPEL